MNNVPALSNFEQQNGTNGSGAKSVSVNGKVSTIDTTLPENK